MSIKGNLYTWLGKKVDKADIKTIYSTAEQEYSFKKLAYEIAISYIASAITKCKFKTYKKYEEIEKEEYYKLNISPNPNENASNLWNKVIDKLYKERRSIGGSERRLFILCG